MENGNMHTKEMSAMRCRLIALDIDGTLTNDDKKITPATRNALLRAQADDVRLALASARPTPGLYEACDALDMRANGGILMAYNGGRIVEASTGRVLSETCMRQNEALQVIRFLQGLPVTVILDDGHQFFVEDAKGYKVDYECRNNRMTCREVEDLAEACTFAPVKLLLSVLPERIHAVQAQIAAFLPDSLTVVRTAAFYLEIIPRQISKGQGLRAICGALGIGLEETMAFGDSENDIPMLEAAGLGIAMGNAELPVKQAAAYVTAGNNEDGIARAMERFL